MNLDFLNDFWDEQKIANRTYSDCINTVITNAVNCSTIPEDKIKTKYLGGKKWDMHLPKKKIVIEYKSICISPITGIRAKNVGVSGTAKRSLASNLRSRTEQAIGCAYDLKAKDPAYKTGYLLIFILDRQLLSTIPKTTIDEGLARFYRMAENKVYDFFCPIITFGINEHHELSKKYTFDVFIEGLKSVESKHLSPLEEFFV